MIKLTPERVAEACGGKLLTNGKAKPSVVQGGVVDSRLTKKGNIFFAIRGERTDGHNYVNQAFAAGASLAVVEHEIPDAEGPCIVVPSSEQALRDIAKYYRSLFNNIPVIAITGSVGKTSTKEMVASVLGERFNVLKTEGNFNNEIGVPLTLLRVRDEHEVAVIEIGIDHFGEMKRVAKIAKPNMCIITNIGYCHLENLIDRNGVLKAKTEIFDAMPSRAPAILNADDDKLATISQNRGITPIFYGIDETKDAEIFASDLEMSGELGSTFTLHYKENSVSAKVYVPGRHMVYNALAAAAVGVHLGLTLEEVAGGIAKMRTIAGRSNFIQRNGYTVIDDCYNANPVSMKAALEVLGSCSGRRIAVLGDMGELGADEKLLHEEVGRAAASLTDLLFACGPLCEELVKGCKSAGKTTDVYYFRDKQEMLRILKGFVQPGDTVLVKASHFMEYSEIVDAL